MRRLVPALLFALFAVLTSGLISLLFARYAPGELPPFGVVPHAYAAPAYERELRADLLFEEPEIESLESVRANHEYAREVRAWIEERLAERGYVVSEGAPEEGGVEVVLFERAQRPSRALLFVERTEGGVFLSVAFAHPLGPVARGEL